MSDSFEKGVEARVVDKGAGFDPESKGYNEVIGRLLKKKYPLLLPKPPTPENPTEEQPDVEQPEELGYAHEAWVWHPEEKDWFKHQASFDRDTGMLLKGMTHPTIGNTLAGEKDFSEIFKDGGYYYRRLLEKK